VAGAAVEEGELKAPELVVVTRVLGAATKPLDRNKVEEILRPRGG
jgi:hypothetical protein